MRPPPMAPCPLESAASLRRWWPICLTTLVTFATSVAGPSPQKEAGPTAAEWEGPDERHLRYDITKDYPPPLLPAAAGH